MFIRLSLCFREEKMLKISLELFKINNNPQHDLTTIYHTILKNTFIIHVLTNMMYLYNVKIYYVILIM